MLRKLWRFFTRLAVAAVVLLLGVKILHKQKSAESKGRRAADLLTESTSRNIHKAKKLTEAANKDKDTAIAAHDEMQRRLKEMGASDEDLDRIAARFNAKRVRRTSGNNS